MRDGNQTEEGEADWGQECRPSVEKLIAAGQRG